MSPTQPDGYLATPAAGSGPPVLVLHAWWGLNQTIKGLCDRLAAEGFLALAPDLYHGEVADTIEGAEKLGSALDGNFKQAKAEIEEATRWLSERSGVASVAVLSFSLGVYYAVDLSTSNPDLVNSVVIFYGDASNDVSASQAAYMGHFAEKDEFVSQEQVEELESALQAAGRPVTFHTYPGTGHWFFEPDREDAYDAAAAQLAWERTLEFLKN
jgi:carboxymethylenebutenolidase